jgi:hypothetical protein
MIKPSKLSLFHGFTRGVVKDLKGPVYLSFNRDLAHSYAEDSGGHVAQVQVSLQKPLRLETGEQVKAAWEASGGLKNGGKFYPDAQNALNDWAAGQGYDGIIVAPSAFEGELGYRWATGTFGEPQVVVFDGAQAKIKGSKSPGSRKPSGR